MDWLSARYDSWQIKGHTLGWTSHVQDQEEVLMEELRWKGLKMVMFWVEFSWPRPRDSLDEHFGGGAMMKRLKA